MSEKPEAKRPFVTTHVRVRDGLTAMLLAIRDGNALYRVQWFENNRRNENTLVRSADAFADAFAARV